MTAATSSARPAPTAVAWEGGDLVLERVFDAPRELVWEAMTRPEHVKHWYGPRSTTLVSCEIDLRPGGRFRFVMRLPDGREFGFGGEYREVVRPERIVNTWGWDGMPGHEALETATFTEEDGRTTVRLGILFPTVEDYAGWAGSGAFGGWAESLDRLAERVAGLR